MKVRYIGFCIAVIALFAGCAEEEIVKNTQPEQEGYVMLQAHSGSSDATASRLAYTDDSSAENNKGVTVTWSAGDAFYLKSNTDEEGQYVHGQLKIVEKETYTATESFEGVLSTSLEDKVEITAFYPSEAYDLESNSFQVDVREATQDANNPMAHLSATNYMIGTGTLNSGVSFEGGNKVAIVRFDLSLPAMKTQVGVSEFQIESADLHTLGTLTADGNSTFTEDALLEKHRQTIHLDGYTAGTSETKLSVYVTMLPTILKGNMIVKLILANGNVYSSKVSFSNGNVVACNRYYIMKELSSLIELDYSWYSSAASNYEIDNERQLFAFSRIVNGTAPSIAQDNFEGKTVTLKDNISLNADWIPIGASNTNGQKHSYFKGTFDGGNHTISNLHLNVDAPEFSFTICHFPFGFFGNVEGATIKNLTIQGDALMKRAVESNHGHFYLGGLIGRAEQTTIENCRNELDLVGSNLYDLQMGGLVGHLVSSSVKACSNAGDLVAMGAKGTPKLGGIMGYGSTNSVIGCYTEDVTIKIVESGSISYIGGIAGQLANASKLIASYSLIQQSNMSSDATGGSADEEGIAVNIGNEGNNASIYGCYAVAKLWEKAYADNSGNVSVGEEINSEGHMTTLNNGIAAWNATLSGVLHPNYCRYIYKQMDGSAENPHLVLEELSGINTGQLEDMGNGGVIGGQ